MSQDQNIDDGYEDNPWDDEDGKNLRIIPDFLPAPEILKNAKIRFVTNDKQLSMNDLQIIERIAAENKMTPTALISYILHDFATGQLVKRGE